METIPVMHEYYLVSLRSRSVQGPTRSSPKSCSLREGLSGLNGHTAHVTSQHDAAQQFRLISRVI